VIVHEKPPAPEGSGEKIEIKFDCGSPRPNGEREDVKKFGISGKYGVRARRLQ
jgi:hypothetical protein